MRVFKKEFIMNINVNINLIVIAIQNPIVTVYGTCFNYPFYILFKSLFMGFVWLA
jgi:hypothetical protein